MHKRRRRRPHHPYDGAAHRAAPMRTKPHIDACHVERVRALRQGPELLPLLKLTEANCARPIVHSNPPCALLVFTSREELRHGVLQTHTHLLLLLVLLNLRRRQPPPTGRRPHVPGRDAVVDGDNHRGRRSRDEADDQLEHEPIILIICHDFVGVGQYSNHSVTVELFEFGDGYSKNACYCLLWRVTIHFPAACCY